MTLKIDNTKVKVTIEINRVLVLVTSRLSFKFVTLFIAENLLKPETVNKIMTAGQFLYRKELFELSVQKPP